MIRGSAWRSMPPARTRKEATARQVARLVQGDACNRSAIRTVACVPLTSDPRWASAPGNVLLPAPLTRLRRDSVANAPPACQRVIRGPRAGNSAPAGTGCPRPSARRSRLDLDVAPADAVNSRSLRCGRSRSSRSSVATAPRRPISGCAAPAPAPRARAGSARGTPPGRRRRTATAAGRPSCS